jgi:hypothetical protein
MIFDVQPTYVHACTRVSGAPRGRTLYVHCRVDLYMQAIGWVSHEFRAVASACCCAHVDMLLEVDVERAGVQHSAHAIICCAAIAC